MLLRFYEKIKVELKIYVWKNILLVFWLDVMYVWLRESILCYIDDFSF